MKSTIIIGIYLNYNDFFTHAQAKDLLYSKIEMSWAEIEALVLQKADFFYFDPILLSISSVPGIQGIS